MRAWGNNRGNRSAERKPQEPHAVPVNPFLPPKEIHRCSRVLDLARERGLAKRSVRLARTEEVESERRDTRPRQRPSALDEQPVRLHAIAREAVKENYAGRAADTRRTMDHAPQAMACRISKFDERFHGEPWRSRSSGIPRSGTA